MAVTFAPVFVWVRGTYGNPTPDWVPRALKIVVVGQKPVKLAWRMFAQARATSNRHHD
jgi:hypothetical protein